MIAVGTEVGSIELYSFKKILMRAEQASRDKTSTAPNTGAEFGASENNAVN